ncbi:adaptin N terminal region-domain-containing protein [Lipomyces japonicus]|uniref:adaptin N terminal region-domain-containing protein n=1 Tax=Lipomyces japonicus TaxID=56871 RepID=UPI0034CE7DF2
MSDAKFFAKGKAAELRQELVSDKKDRNFVRRKTALKRVVANMTMNNNEMIQLFPDVLHCMTIDNLEIKKMCFLYLINYSRLKPDLARNALSILLNDLEDRSPLVRALALRTISCIPIPAFSEALIRPLGEKLLRDSDPYVRKTAAFAVAKLWTSDHDSVEKNGLIDHVNQLLVDSNPTVVSAGLAALHDITDRSEGMKLSIGYQDASKILQILGDCNEWSQTYILNALMSYTPHDSAEALLMAERLTPRLQHSNASVVLGTIRAILYLTNYIADDNVIHSLVQRFGPPLVTLLAKPSEIQYVALRNCFLILQQHPEILQNDIKVFYCKYNDPIYVKVTKLEIIFLLASANNIKEILRELKEYASEIDVQFVRKAVRAIGKLAIKIEAAARPCIDTLLDLVATRVSYIVQEATVVIKNIFRKYPNRYESIISVLCQNLDSLDEPEAKAAMIWIIGQYADRIENSDELLDEFLFTFKEEPVEVQLSLLTATVKLFIQRPTKGQELVLQVLKWATEEIDNPDLRDRGYMYWRLLSASAGNSNITKNVVMSEKPTISVESEKFDDKTLEEMSLNIGTLSAIYLKPVNQIFKNAKVKRLEPSPALRKKFLNVFSTQEQQQQQQKTSTDLIQDTYFQTGLSNNELGNGPSGYFDMSRLASTDPIATPVAYNGQGIIGHDLAIASARTTVGAMHGLPEGYGLPGRSTTSSSANQDDLLW